MFYISLLSGLGNWEHIHKINRWSTKKSKYQLQRDHLDGRQKLHHTYCSIKSNLICTILSKDIEGHNSSSMDVPLGDQVAFQLPLQTVVIPPQDVVGDVEVDVVVELPAGDVEEPVEIASPRHPEGWRQWRGQPPRLNKKVVNLQGWTKTFMRRKMLLYLESSVGMLENLCTWKNLLLGVHSPRNNQPLEQKKTIYVIFLGETFCRFVSYIPHAWSTLAPFSSGRCLVVTCNTTIPDIFQCCWPGLPTRPALWPVIETCQTQKVSLASPHSQQDLSSDGAGNHQWWPQWTGQSTKKSEI